MHGSEEVTTSPLKRKINQAEASEYAARGETTVSAAKARNRPDTHTGARRTLHEDMGAAQLPEESDPEVTLKAASRNAWDGLSNMTQDELCNYLGAISADEDFIANIVSNQIDGAQWVAMFTTSDNKVVDSNEYKEIIDVFAGERTPPFFKIKAKTHLTLTLQSLQQSSKVEEKGEKQAAEFSIKDLYSMRIPELPAGDGGGGRLSSAQVRAYKDLLQSTINIVKREYCEKIEVLHNHPTSVRLDICLAELDLQEQQIDELLGQTLMKSSKERTMQWIISMGYHLHMVGGLSKYSGLCILQVIFEAITQLTGAKLGATLKVLFEPLSSPASEIKFLEGEYKKHSEAIAQLEVMSGTMTDCQVGDQKKCIISVIRKKKSDHPTPFNSRCGERSMSSVPPEKPRRSGRKLQTPKAAQPACSKETGSKTQRSGRKKCTGMAVFSDAVHDLKQLTITGHQKLNRPMRRTTH